MLERAVCDTERGTARHGVCIYAITGQVRAGTTGTKPFFVYTLIKRRRHGSVSHGQ